eukprot:TRINITY_DN30052_c0_g1_i1.p1 TRINITY_DN30052_c0_g1~~TRINITY_DN30052_c0_g1_i1.p1  ORF type:complete len:484 (-),score=75.73 TRINITY_DN30052_c0_g1_i1:203-1654(-)
MHRCRRSLVTTTSRGARRFHALPPVRQRVSCEASVFQRSRLSEDSGGASVCRRRWTASTSSASSASDPGREDASTSSKRSGRLLETIIEAEGERRFTFVGGKGGVGKTTTASAIAVSLARAGHKTLIVSIDPAHSLGDALGVRLSGTPQPVILPSATTSSTDTGAGGSLHAMEIDPQAVVAEFRRGISVPRLKQLLREPSGGIGTGILGALSKAGVDLEAAVNLLEVSPPGIDEAVALARMMQLLGDNSEFSRVVIDTAPTGHTLRLLSFPQFLHSVVDMILSIQEKLSQGFSPLGSLLGRVMGDDLQRQLHVTKEGLERFMSSMAALNEVFADERATDFVVVTIPTHLAVAESKRLMESLATSGMPARFLVVNQSPLLGAGGSPAGATATVAAIRAIAKLPEAQQQLLNDGISEEDIAQLCKTLDLLKLQREEAQKQIDALMDGLPMSVRLAQVPAMGAQPVGLAALETYAQALRGPGGEGE